MASIFPIPTLRTLISRVATDYFDELGAAATIRRTFPRTLARSQAAVAHGLYGLVQKAVTELHPWTATSYGVTFWASVLDVKRRAAVRATLEVDATGTPATDIPAGTTYVRDDGAEYLSTTLVTLDGSGEGTVTVQADTAGKAGNCDAGVILKLATPIAGVAASAAVSATTTTGLDEESLEALKGRTLERLAKPPQGGAVADYEKWTKESGVDVARVWVTPLWAGEGTVLVRFTVSDDDPIPSGGQVTTVQTYVDARRPVTAHVTVSAPVAKPWAFEMSVAAETGALLDDVKAAIYAEIRALFRTVEPSGTVPRSVLDAAISRAKGEDHHELLTMDGGGGAVDPGDLTHGAGEIPTLADGAITWV